MSGKKCYLLPREGLDDANYKKECIAKNFFYKKCYFYVQKHINV